jgi:hypothetical protein
VRSSDASPYALAVEARSASSTVLSRNLLIRLRQDSHLASPSQTTQRVPTPCQRYQAPEWHAQSPLRTVTLQEDIKLPQPAVLLYRRHRNQDRPSAREALSRALSSNSPVRLLPRERNSATGSTWPRRPCAATKLRPSYASIKCAHHRCVTANAD